MISIKKSLHKLVQDESGQDMVEYALVAGFISLAGIASFSGIANSITTIFTKIATNLSSAAAGNSGGS
jgi:pilus assembly protein Flp/PilA